MTSKSINDYYPSGKSNLKPEVKVAWLKVLRSGQRQIEGNLKARDECGRIGYCCLGLLCDLGKDANKRWVKDDALLSPFGDSWQYGSSYNYSDDGYPPNDVLEKSGLHKKDAVTLAIMNDAGIGFKQIARWIEKHL